MGPQSDFKESINERKQMEQRCLPAHCSEMENTTGYSSTAHRPGQRGGHPQGLWETAPIQEPGLEEEFIIPVSSPIAVQVKTLERTAQLAQ